MTTLAAPRSGASPAFESHPRSQAMAPEGGEGRTRVWVVSSLAVTALHVGVVAAGLWWLHPAFMAPPPPPVAMMIDLAPVPQPPVVEKKVEPPQPKVEPKPVEKPKPAVRKVEPVQQRPKPPPLPHVTPPPQPTPASEVAATSAVPEPPAPPSQVAPAPPAAPAVAATPPSTAVPTWQGRLLARLERYKRYPAIARLRNDQGTVVVRFVMNREGEVLSTHLERGSGSDSLDREALALIERAQPLPAPPDDVKGETIELVVPIQFFLR